jgi:hypothetical protein
VLIQFASSVFALLLVSCASSTIPSARDLDAQRQRLRQEMNEDYRALAMERAQGRINEAQYREGVDRLDRLVLMKSAKACWARHEMAQSEDRANGIPTPDRPVALSPPNAGGGQGSLYQSPRLSGSANQAQGVLQQITTATAQSGRVAGSVYDR